MAPNSNVVYIGIGGQVVAIDSASGAELWRTKIKSQTLVTIQVSGNRVFAGSYGELFCLDAATGEILWHNKLKGLGIGAICFSGTTDPATAVSATMPSQAT